MNGYEPKRLLCIISSMNTGGAETFLMKLYRNLDRSKYQMDFLVSVKETSYYDNEIKSLGGKVYYNIPKSKNVFKSLYGIYKIVKNKKYKYTMRVNQHSLSSLDLLAAKLGGAKVLIQRSSNTSSGTALGRILHRLFLPLSIIVPNVKLAPSSEAAKYTFGSNSIKKGKASLLNNAIDLDEFTYQQEIREMTRQELNLKDNFVVGHVGRFNKQKNHDFLIEIFADIIKKKPKSILLLIGRGELEDKLKNKIKSLGIENSVVFTGVRSDISKIMMAMDVFVFPSFYEGMPNTVLEAQATGLSCLISDKITKEVKITNLVKFLPLQKKTDQWVNSALNCINKLNRTQAKNVLYKKGYDIETVSKKFINFVFKDDDIFQNKP